MAPIYTRIYTQPVEFNRALGYAYDALVYGPYPFDAITTWKGLSERIAQGVYMGQGLLLPGLQALSRRIVAPFGDRKI